MLQGRHANEVVVKDLILMVIDCNVLGIVIRGSEETVPIVWWLETIMKYNWCVGDLAGLTITISVELFCYFEAEIIKVERRFIQKLDADDNVLVLCLRIPV